MAGQRAASRFQFKDLLPRLRALARGRDKIDVAQLQFVGLAEIQSAYGDRWPEQKRKIRDAAETYLRKRTDTADLVIPGEDGFLILLGSVAGAEAHATAAQLTHGLNSFFLGEGFPRELRMGGAVRTSAVKDLEASLAPDTPDDEAGASLEARPGVAGLEWRFEPVWDARRELLSHWFAVPFNRATGMRVPGYQFENCPTHPSQFIEIDEASLWTAENALTELIQAGKPSLVGAAIHVGSLASLSSRARLLASIDRLNAELHRFRIIKIAGVSPGFPRMYVNEIVGALKARLPNVTISAAWDEPDIAGLAQSGVAAVGVSIPASSLISGPVVAIPTLVGRISESARMAHGARVRFFVEGAVTKFLALKLVKAGVDDVASESIWPGGPSVEGILNWPKRALAAA